MFQKCYLTVLIHLGKDIKEQRHFISTMITLSKHIICFELNIVSPYFISLPSVLYTNYTSRIKLLFVYSL